MQGGQTPIQIDNIKGYEEGQEGPYVVQLSAHGKIQDQVYINQDYSSLERLYVVEYDKESDTVKLLKSVNFTDDIIICTKVDSDICDFKFQYPSSKTMQHYNIVRRIRPGLIDMSFDFQNLQFVQVTDQALPNNVQSVIGYPKRFVNDTAQYVQVSLPNMQNVKYVAENLCLFEGTKQITGCDVVGSNIFISDCENVKINNSSKVYIDSNSKNIQIQDSQNIFIGKDCTGNILIKESGSVDNKIIINDECAQQGGLILMPKDCAKKFPITIQKGSAKSGTIIIRPDNGFIDIYSNQYDLINIQLPLDQSIIMRQ
eukprot:EST46278.1 Hypothetical protein SS50377_13712 [Spironucleus salmonicida]